MNRRVPMESVPNADNQQFDVPAGRGPRQGGTFQNFRQNNSYNKRNRRGGYAPKQEQSAPQPPVAERPKMKPPMHLSKTSSELKNDPAHKDAFMPSAAEELIPIAEEHYHYPGCDGVVALIDETYETIGSYSKNFKESISHSAYSYYISVLLWARMLYLKQKNKQKLTFEELSFIDSVYQDGGYSMPESVHTYLACFGNMNVPSSITTKFNMKPYKYNGGGFFKDMEKDFYLMSSYPCIAIFAQRIQEDLRVTDDHQLDPKWQPDDIDQEFKPTCIGYHDATILGQRQRDFLMRCVTNDDFGSDNEILPLNTGLMNGVEKYLKTVKNIKLMQMPNTVTGSVGQLLLETPVNTALSEISYRAQSGLRVDGSISYLCGTFLYRVNKQLTSAKARYLMPYKIEHPSHAQIAILNRLNMDWPAILNDEIIHYENVPFNPKLRLKKIVAQDVTL